MPLVFVGLAGVVVFGFLLLIGQGSVAIPIGEVASILTGGDANREVHHTIVFDARLPKAITAVVAGYALAGGGPQIQQIFRNPLADPPHPWVRPGATPGAALVPL